MASAVDIAGAPASPGGPIGSMAFLDRLPVMNFDEGVDMCGTVASLDNLSVGTVLDNLPVGSILSFDGDGFVAPGTCKLAEPSEGFEFDGDCRPREDAAYGLQELPPYLAEPDVMLAIHARLNSELEEQQQHQDEDVHPEDIACLQTPVEHISADSSSKLEQPPEEIVSPLHSALRQIPKRAEQPPQESTISPLQQRPERSSEVPLIQFQFGTPVSAVSTFPPRQLAAIPEPSKFQSAVAALHQEQGGLESPTVVLECTYAEGIDVTKLPLGQRCVAFGQGCELPWTVGRQKQMQMLTRLVPDDASRNCISRNHFEIMIENATTMVKRLAQNGLLIDNTHVGFHHMSSIRNGTTIGICRAEGETSFLTFSALLPDSEAGQQQDSSLCPQGGDRAVDVNAQSFTAIPSRIASNASESTNSHELGCVAGSDGHARAKPTLELAQDSTLRLELCGSALRNDMSIDRRCIRELGTRMVVGRAHQLDLHLQALSEEVFPWVSRDHFRIEQIDGSYQLTALSSNPIWLERSGERHMLQKGSFAISVEGGDVIHLFTGATDGTPDGSGCKGTLQWHVVADTKPGSEPDGSGTCSSPANIVTPQNRPSKLTAITPQSVASSMQGRSPPAPMVPGRAQASPSAHTTSAQVSPTAQASPSAGSLSRSVHATSSAQALSSAVTRAPTNTLAAVAPSTPTALSSALKPASNALTSPATVSPTVGATSARRATTPVRISPPTMANIPTVAPTPTPTATRATTPVRRSVSIAVPPSSGYPQAPQVVQQSELSTPVFPSAPSTCIASHVRDVTPPRVLTPRSGTTLGADQMPPTFGVRTPPGTPRLISRQVSMPAAVAFRQQQPLQDPAAVLQQAQRPNMQMPRLETPPEALWFQAAAIAMANTRPKPPI